MSANMVNWLRALVFAVVIPVALVTSLSAAQHAYAAPSTVALNAAPAASQPPATAVLTAARTVPVSTVETSRVGFVVADNDNEYGVTPDMVSLDGFDALSAAGFKGDPSDGREMIYVPAGTMVAFPGDVNGNAYVGVDVDGSVSECWDSASHKCTSADVLPSTVV